MASRPLWYRLSTATPVDTFTAVWRKVFSQVEVTRTSSGLGFMCDDQEEDGTMADDFPEVATPFDVMQSLRRYGADRGIVVMLDELDRLSEREPTRLIADTLKGLSDQGRKSHDHYDWRRRVCVCTH